MFEEFVNDKIKTLTADLTDSKVAPISEKVDNLTDGIFQLTDIISDIPDMISEEVKPITEGLLSLENQFKNIKLQKGDTGEKGDKGDKGDKGENGIDGVDGLDGSPDTPKDIVKKLESLKGEKRLSSKAIKGLETYTTQKDLERATSILDQRTSFLINKVNNLANDGGNAHGSTGEIQYNNNDAFFSDSLFYRNPTTKEYYLGKYTTAVEVPVGFDGSGLDDLTVDFSGVTATRPISLNVVISATGTPDEFDWDDNLGNGATGVAITGSAQTLSNGITITFGATTGHTGLDNWAFGYVPSLLSEHKMSDALALGQFGGETMYMEDGDGNYSTLGTFASDSGIISGVIGNADGVSSLNATLPGLANISNIESTDYKSNLYQFVNGFNWTVQDKNTLDQASIKLTANGFNINDAYTFPITDGTTGYALVTDGAGNVSWGSAGGTPSLATTEIAYGDGSNLMTSTPGFNYSDNGTNLAQLTVENPDATAGIYLNATGIASEVTAVGELTVISGQNQNLILKGGTASGTDIGGGSLTISGGASTGTASGGVVYLNYVPASAISGSSVNNPETFILGNPLERAVYIGDVYSAVNGTLVKVDDPNELVTVTATNGLTINDYTMPLVDGTAGYAMVTDGAGTISFAAVTPLFNETSFTAQTSVTVTHNFGNYPIVQVMDNTNAVIVPLTITHGSVNDFTVTFTGSTTGKILSMR